MNRSVVAFLLATWISIAVAQSTPERPPVDIKGAELVWAGVYEGIEDWFNHPTLLEGTDRIPAKGGLKFGIYFVIHSEPAAGILTVRYRTTVPPPGFPERSGGKGQVMESKIQCILGKPCLAGFRFDSDKEIVVGRWVLEIFYRDTKVIEHTFEVELASTAQRTEVVCEIAEPDCPFVLSAVPNHFIERTSSGGLRLPPVAAHFER